MSLSFFRSLALPGLAVLLIAGCAPAKEDTVTPESMKKRLENQAKAVAALSSENDKLRDDIAELKKENASLRRSLELVKKVLKKYSAKPAEAVEPAP